MLKPTIALGLLLSAVSFNTNAASLTPYTVSGANLVYSGVSNVTWTQDANLFKTLYDANNNLVNLITSVTPSYNDPSWGLQTIDDNPQVVFDDFDTATGRLSWWGGIAFVNYLNSISYGGSKQWRLPTAGSNPQLGYNQTGSELGQLFYNELSGTELNVIPDTVNFINEQVFQYWSVSEYAFNPGLAWQFNTKDGYQLASPKGQWHYSWVVSSGRVTAAVPEPGVMWLLGIGLLGLTGLKRRRHAG